MYTMHCATHAGSIEASPIINQEQPFVPQLPFARRTWDNQNSRDKISRDWQA